MSGYGDLLGNPLGEVGIDLACRHLEQLQTKKSLLGVRPSTPVPRETILAQLTEWTNANIDHIENAVTKGAFSKGSNTTDWEITFLAFMESAATYLRDEQKLAKAVDLYKSGSENLASTENRKALQLYFDSTADINTLANLWGLKFQMICDLPDKNKSGNIFIGPYCGCFYSPGTNKIPFMSIAFKGTNFADIGEGIVDFAYDTFKAPNDKLFGTDVSIGVYDSLFSQFEIGSTTTSPFELILQNLASIAASIQPPKEDTSQADIVPIIHVTGHSLGASYACFCFAQLLTSNQGFTQSGWQLGDIYTFGCPRVGKSDWANAFFTAMTSHSGVSVRVVNQQDLVPQLVPLTDRDSAPYFNHIDSGWNIFPNKPQIAIPSERGIVPVALDSIWDWSRDVTDHHTESYYASLLNVLNSGS